MFLDRRDCQPPDQINADPGVTGFSQFLAGTGSMVLGGEMLDQMLILLMNH